MTGGIMVMADNDYQVLLMALKDIQERLSVLPCIENVGKISSLGARLDAIDLTKITDARKKVEKLDKTIKIYMACIVGGTFVLNIITTIISKYIKI